MGKGLSLHIGINAVDPAHYAGWSGPLQACQADAEDLEALARGQGFETRVLRTGEATRATVRAAIETAASSLQPGDIYFLSYSGHGGQVPDRDGDEPDGQDETWCLYDGQLVDDELNELWAGFAKGVRILVLSDSCHSGSVVRALLNPAPATGGPSYRFMPREICARTYRLHQAFYDGLAAASQKASPVVASVRLLAACQDNQYAQDGTFNGLFTATLLRVWNGGKFASDYRRFHRAIVSRMPPTQSPNHFLLGSRDTSFDAQKPFSI